MSTEFDLSSPFPEIFPKKWNEQIGPRKFMMFRNLEHFKHYVSKLTQKKDDYCGISYADALKEMVSGVSNFPDSEKAEIRNLVRSNLHKRGLITQEIYEAFQYSVDGTKVGVDVGKYAAGEPDCVITPAKEYVDFFYELYVSISYPYSVPNERVRENAAKLLATIEELERQHIFIKITLVLPIRGCERREEESYGNFFATVPLFSHKDFKSVDTMSAVVNDRLLRKFFFAVLEDLYGSNLDSGYGYPITLDTAMSIGKDFNEVDFFTDILEKVGAK
jgi:hypothetical protein